VPKPAIGGGVKDDKILVLVLIGALLRVFSSLSLLATWGFRVNPLFRL